MIDTSTMIMAIGFAAPLFSSLVCGLMVWANHRRTREGIDKKISMLLLLIFSTSLFTWISMLFFLLHPTIFVCLQSGAYLTLLGTVVLLYHFVFLLTRQDTHERLSRLHLFIPLLIAGLLFVWSFFVPFDVQLSLVVNKERIYPGYEAYSILFLSKTPVFMIYNTVYSLLCLRRIMQYRSVIDDYSADEGRCPTRWLYLLFFVMLGIIPFTLLGLFFDRDSLVHSVITLLPVALIIFRNIIICYNGIAGNYILIESEKATEIAPNPTQKETTRINKEEFEQYIHQQKPFLNPELRIVNMAADLHTNRTYLSAFINAEYGMNFSRYINHLRIKELEERSADSFYRNQNRLELIQSVGFSSYRGYLRIKNDSYFN